MLFYLKGNSKSESGGKEGVERKEWKEGRCSCDVMYKRRLKGNRFIRTLIK